MAGPAARPPCLARMLTRDRAGSRGRPRRHPPTVPAGRTGGRPLALGCGSAGTTAAASSGRRHVIDRNRGQTTAAETPSESDNPAAADGATSNVSSALEALYARHTPDLDHTGAQRATLVAAARSHHRMAVRRVAGQELIRIRPMDDEEALAGVRGGAVVEIVTDDMPYLVESVLAAVGRAGRRGPAVIHPIVVVERTPDGELREVLPDADPAEPPPGAIAESWIHVDLGGPAPSGLHADLADVLTSSVRSSATLPRWSARPSARRPAARRRLARMPDRSEGHALQTPPPRDDVANLLRWLADGHFTFLGHRYLAADGNRLVPREPGLGLLRSDSDTLAVTLTPERTDLGRAPRGPVRDHPRQPPRAGCCAPCSPTTSPCA